VVACTPCTSVSGVCTGSWGCSIGTGDKVRCGAVRAGEWVRGRRFGSVTGGYDVARTGDGARRTGDGVKDARDGELAGVLKLTLRCLLPKL